MAQNPHEFGKDGKKGDSKKTYWNRRINQWRQDTKPNGGQKLVINTKSIRTRTRVSGKQGAPVKTAAIEEDLVLWLSQMHRKGVRVKPKLFLQKAKALRISYVRIAIKKGHPVKVQNCDDMWSRRVRARHCISLRRPKVRWKVSYRVLCERQRITWSNVYRCRTAIRENFGYDPEIFGFSIKSPSTTMKVGPRSKRLWMSSERPMSRCERITRRQGRDGRLQHLALTGWSGLAKHHLAIAYSRVARGCLLAWPRYSKSCALADTISYTCDATILRHTAQKIYWICSRTR